MSAQPIGVQIGIEGTAEYINDLNRLVQETKTFKAELQNASKFDNPSEKASGMYSALSNEIESQKKVIQGYVESLEAARDKYGENSKKVLEWEEKIYKANSALQSMEKQLRNISEAKFELPNVEAAVKAYQSEFERLASSDIGAFDFAGAFTKASGMKSSLTSEIESQQKAVSLLEEEYRRVSESQGQYSTEALRAKAKMESGTKSLQDMQKQLKELPNGFEIAGKAQVDFGNKIAAPGKEFLAAAKAFAPATAVIGAGYTAATKSALSFEQGLTGVKKTVEETANTSYQDLANATKRLSEATGFTKKDIFSVMETAGQLDVSADYIEGFTKTVLDLGVSTNLSTDEAATSLARFANVTNTSLGDVDRLGSVIVDLGNNSATTEEEILTMATRMASTGTIAGFSATDILALSASLSSTGVQAEAGATAISQTAKQITKATELAGTAADESGQYSKQLEILGSTAGMTGEEFKQAWQVDAAGAFAAFIGGLSKSKDQGESTILTLDELGMSGVRQSNAIQALSLTYENLTRYTDMANEAFEENSALTEESSKFYDTHAQKVEQTKQRIDTLAEEVGEKLLPLVEKGLDFLNDLIDAWNGLPPEMQETVVQLGLIVGGIAPVLGGVGGLLTGIGGIVGAGGHLLDGTGQLIRLFTGGGGVVEAAGTVAGAKGIGGIISAIGSGASGLIGALGSAASAAAPFLATGAVVVGVVAGAAFLGYELYKHWDEISAWASETWSSVKESVGSAWESVTEKTSSAISTVKEKVVTGFSELASSASEKWGSIKEHVADAWSNIREKTSTTVSDVMGRTKEGFSEIAANAKEKWNDVKENISSAWSDIKEKTSSAVSEIKADISEKWQTISSYTEEKWTAIKETVAEKIESAADTAKTKLEEMREKAESSFSEMKETAQSRMGEIRETISEKFNEAKESASEAMEGLGSNVESTLGSLADNAWEWGSDLCSGIADGIWSGIKWVQSAASSLAGTVSSYIHFSEPDRGPLSDFHTYMPDMMKQLARGIYQNMGRVERAANALAETLAPGVELPDTGGLYSAGAGTRVQYGDVHIEIYGAEGQDVNEIADAVIERFVFLRDRERAVYA